MLPVFVNPPQVGTVSRAMVSTPLEPHLRMNNMNKKLRNLVLLAIISTGSASAFAQFGALAGALGGGGSSSGSVTPEKIVTSYVAGDELVKSGQKKMITALGLKTQEALAVLESKNYSASPTKSEIEESGRVQTAGNKAIEEGMAAQAGQMSDSSKKEFVGGIGSLALGVKKYSDMSSDLSNFKPGLSSIGGAAMSAVAIVPMVPTSISNLVATLKKAIAFSREQKMPGSESNTGAGLPGF